jgi:hypothetical protein
MTLMPFDDDVRDAECARPTALLFRCRRCTELVTEQHDDATAALRRAIETGDLLRVHGCADVLNVASGASGVAELIGTSAPKPEAA